MSEVKNGIIQTGQAEGLTPAQAEGLTPAQAEAIERDRSAHS